MSWKLYDTDGETLLAEGGSPGDPYTYLAPTQEPTPAPEPTPGLAVSTILQLHMFDSFGDGWNGGTWTVSSDTTTWEVSGTMQTGSEGIATIELPSSGSYTFEMEWRNLDRFLGYYNLGSEWHHA